VGWYTLGPEILRRQAALAKRHGIYGFCFHHYWFSGKRLMERPVDSLLEHPDIDLPFCLNWANENWTRRWDGHDEDILIAQRYAPEDDAAFMRDLLRYFSDGRYIRIEGRPLLLVYKAQLLPEPLSAVARWREACAEAGERPPFLAMVQSYYPCKNPHDFGFDAVVQFPPHGIQNEVWVPGVHDDFEGRFLSYSGIMKSQAACWTNKWPVFPGVVPAWDNTPRRMDKATIVAGTSPEAYEHWLKKARAFVFQENAPELRYVFINSWNEWAEGAVLEPSSTAGFAYLNATARGSSSD
jgi:lipopolysaccharide biosynthesis protein